MAPGSLYSHRFRAFHANMVGEFLEPLYLQTIEKLVLSLSYNFFLKNFRSY